MDRTYVILDRADYEMFLKLKNEPLRGIQIDDMTSETATQAGILSFAINYLYCAGISIDFTLKDLGDVTVTFGGATTTRAQVIADLNAQLPGYTASEYDVDGIRIVSDDTGVDKGFLEYPTGGFFAMSWIGVAIGSGLPVNEVEGSMYLITDGANAGKIRYVRVGEDDVYITPVVGSYVFDKNTGRRWDFNGTDWWPHGRKSVRIMDNTVPNGPRRFWQVPIWSDEGNIIQYSITCFVGTHNIAVPDEFFDVDSFEFFIQVDPAIEGIKFYRIGETIGWVLPKDVTGNLFTMYHVMISGGQMSITGMTTSADWT